MNTRALGYVRVSTDQQDIGPEVQITALAAEAERRGWTLEIRREDAASAKSLRGRPVLAQTLADLKAGRADVLAVSKLDRLSRSVADFSRLLEDAGHQHWDLVCLDLGVDTTDPVGKAMAHVTVTFAELERSRIGERTREAMATLPDEVRDRMRRGGRPRALPPETEALIRRWKAEGMTLKAIAERLTAEGVPTASGGRWWPATVAKVLARH